MLPGRGGTGVTRLGSGGEAVRDLARRPVAAADERAGRRGVGRVQRSGPTTTRTSTPCSSTARRSARRARRESRASRCPFRRAGTASRCGEARADAVVAAERPAGVRRADGPAVRGGDGRSRGRGRGCGRCGRRRRRRWRRWRRRRRDGELRARAAPGGGGGGAGTGSPTAAPGAAAPGPVRGRDRAALPGAGLGRHVLQQVRASAPTAQLVPVTQLPQLRFVSGLAIVVPGFQTREQAQKFCTTPAPASRPAARRSRPPRPDPGGCKARSGCIGCR